MSGMKMIEFQNVFFSRKDRMILQGINLAVEQGESMVLLGRSGSGKTTLLKLINALLTPTSGHVLVENISTGERDPIELRRHIGYVIQDVGLFPHFTVAENIGIVPMLLGWAKEKIKQKTDELLEIVGLDKAVFANRYPRELSGGQSQRVGVARALAADPPIILFDEPFGSLDTITRREMQEEFKNLQARLHQTIIFVTHDIQEAFLFASRIGIIQEGKLIFVGTPEEVLASPIFEVKELVKGFE